MPTVVAGLLAALLVVSIPCAAHLLLAEYLRLFIVGIGVALVCVPRPEQFAAQPLRVCMLAAAVVYVLYALDPATNGAAALDAGVRAVNLYRVVSVVLLGAGAIGVVVNWMNRPRPLVRFRLLISETDRYALVLLLCGGAVLAALQVVQAVNEHTSVADAALRGSKCVDWIAAYLLVLVVVRDGAAGQMARIRALVLGVLALCIAASLLGGVQATRAYLLVRMPPDLATTDAARAEIVVGQRERLLRVFSLNSDEALLMYEAGYYTGLDDNARRGVRMNRATDTYPRYTVQDVETAHLISVGDYRGAIRTLEALPRFHHLSGFTRTHLDDLSACLARANGDPAVHYLLGLLAMHEDDGVTATNEFHLFLAAVSNHANAVHLLRTCEGGEGAAAPRLEMAACGWLAPRVGDKPIAERGSHVVLLYNQQVKGFLWLPTGAYAVVVWARDDGTPHDLAVSAQFDPACKMRAWLGRSGADFVVVSTNHEFQPYSFNATVRTTPAAMVIEFANDVNDTTRALDRNLAVSRIEFIRKEKP